MKQHAEAVTLGQKENECRGSIERSSQTEQWRGVGVGESINNKILDGLSRLDGRNS